MSSNCIFTFVFEEQAGFAREAVDLEAGDPGPELRAALEDPCLEVDELEHLLSEARRKGGDIDPGLIADVEFHAQRLARFLGAEGG